MTTLSQRTFSSGEISPSLYARVDLVKYATGLRTCKNAIVLRYGGVSNRPGTQYVGEVSDSTKQVRLVPFIFSDDVTYVLQFGEYYMRVIRDGAQVTEGALPITAISVGLTTEVTIPAHGYTNGDEIFLEGIQGTTELNFRNFKIEVVDPNIVRLILMDGTTNLNSTGYGAYTSGGEAKKIYEIATPYDEIETLDFNYVQSADIITIAHPSYPPYEILRFGETDWQLQKVAFLPTTAQPTSVTASGGPSGSETFRYAVTAIDATGEESLVGTGVDLYTTDSGVDTGGGDFDISVFDSGTGLEDGDEIFFLTMGNVTDLTNRLFTVDDVQASYFKLLDTKSSDYPAWNGATQGTYRKAFVKITGKGTPTTASPITISWTAAPGAVEYNVYKENNGVYGQIGVASGTSFKDINITPNNSFTPPKGVNPFVGIGNYPATVTYVQQRLTFASTDNEPEKIWMSRTGNFKNFTKSSPSQSDDSIQFTMAGRQVNQVRNLVDLGRLVILTSGGEWALEGGQDGVITPSTLNTKQYSYNGSGFLAPILIDGAALYQQARGSIIRDLGYDFQVDGYKGNDLTIFSAHLFDKFTIVDWAYQQIPQSVLWVVRSDGVLLGMTYVKNQEILAWHRHDLGGFVENVSVIPEGNEDVVYVTVRRTVNNLSKRYIEVFNTRQITNIVESKFMDSNLTYDGRNYNASHTMTLSGGTAWDNTENITLTSSISYFSSADVGNAIHFTDNNGDPLRLLITSFNSDTEVVGTPHKVIPFELRTVPLPTWTKAVDEVEGLWHIEGKEVAVFGDGFVVASPNNASYTTVSVANGKIALDKPYGVIHVGLPYLTDLETLDIDSQEGETLADKQKIVGEVTLLVEETRGVWVGPRPPSDDTVDPLEDLQEFKLRNTEDYESPPSLITDNISMNIKPEWNSNGRVFIRQVDPIPLTVLSVNPAGKYPFN